MEHYDLSYFRRKLKDISEAVDCATGLLPDEKTEFKQKLTMPIVYCLDRDFKVAREGWHVITK